MFFKINNRKILSNFIVLIFIVVTFLSITYGTGLLNSGFRYFIDDHQIPVMYNDLVDKGFLETLYTWVQYEQSLSRFRPYYEIHMVMLTQIFGLNSFLWFLYISILGSLTTFFLFLFARLLNFSVLISLIFSISILLGIQAEIWARPMIPDAHALFFLSLSLVFLGLSCQHKNKQIFNNSCFFILVILMSLCKESYIIFIPTLMVGKVFLYQYYRKLSLWQALKQNKFSLVFLGSIFILEISYIILYLGTGGTGYAGVDEKSFQIVSILSTGNVFFAESFLLITLIGIVLSLILTKFKQESILVPVREFTPFLILLLIAVVPHLLLYAKSGITAGFYLFPAIVIPCLFLAKVLSYISRYSQWLSWLLIAVLVVILFPRVPLVLNMYSLQANDSKYMNALVKQVELCTPNNQKILIVANPRIRYEVINALPRVFKNVIYRDNLLIGTYGLEKTQFYSDTLKEAEKNWTFLDPESVLGLYENKTLLNTDNKNNIKAILIFDDLDNDFIKTNKDWFRNQEYELHEFKISFALVRLYCKQSHSSP